MPGNVKFVAPEGQFCYFFVLDEKRWVDEKMSEIRRRKLLEALQDPDEEVRHAAAEALEKLESAMGLGQILQALKGEDRGKRIRAVYSLGKVNDPGVYPPLLSALKSPDPDLRSAAVQVLGEKGNPKTLGALVRHLKDPHPAVRVHTAEALSRFSDRRLLPYLAALLKEKEEEVGAAIRAMGSIGDPEAQKYLLPLLADTRAAIRRQAAEALGNLRIQG